MALSRRVVCVLALLVALPGTALADYAVGRLSSLAGTATVQTPGDPETHYAALNEVLAEGDQLATGDGDAELQFGNALIEVGPGSVVVLTRVTTDGLGLYLAQGSLAAARLGGDGSPTVLLQGPRSANYLDTSGRYRFDVWPDSQDEALAVRQGRAISEFDQRSISLYAGQSVALSAPASDEGVTLVNAPQPDALDYLLETRLQGVRSSPLQRRLRGDWIGATALDDQGEWLEVTSAGPLWVPFFLPAGWAPYQYGHWQWNGVWGWTWVDDLPWAYAPYHYGRWIWWNNRWAWSPQGRVPVFSPRGYCPPGVIAPPLPAPGRLASVRPLVPLVPLTPPGNRLNQAAVSPVARLPLRPHAPPPPPPVLRVQAPVQVAPTSMPAAPPPPARALAAPIAPAPLTVPIPVPMQPRFGGGVPGTRGELPPPPPEAFRGRTFEAPGDKGRAERGAGMEHGGAEHGHPQPAPGAPATVPAGAHARASVSGAARPAASPGESPPNASGGASARPGKGF